MSSKTLSKYLEQVENNIEGLKERNIGVFNAKCLFAFRGESKDYKETKLMPTLFRDNSYVPKEKYLFDLLHDYNVISGDKYKYIEKIIDAQHYVAITRMLDITFNVLVAFYFACISNKRDKGYVYIFCFPEYYSPNSTYIEKFYSEILKGNNLIYSKNFKVVSHSFSNDRIKAQMGGFILFQGREYSAFSKIYYRRIEIEASDKEKILNDLDIIFGIRESTIFPDKEKRANLVGERFRKDSFKERSISVESEIDITLERLYYEKKMKIKEYKDKFDSIKYLRKLRKEKADLLEYIQLNENEIENRTKFLKYVEESFELLKKI